MSRNIFEHKYGENSSFDLCVEDRIRKVKDCDSVDDLKYALGIIGLQSTVRKAIEVRIRKLERAEKK